MRVSNTTGHAPYHSASRGSSRIVASACLHENSIRISATTRGHSPNGKASLVELQLWESRCSPRTRREDDAVCKIRRSVRTAHADGAWVQVRCRCRFGDERDDVLARLDGGPKCDDGIEEDLEGASSLRPPALFAEVPRAARIAADPRIVGWRECGADGLPSRKKPNGCTLCDVVVVYSVQRSIADVEHARAGER